MVPFPVAALAAWLVPPPVATLAVALVALWGGSILIFHAGVRRGLSFRTPGGPRPVQLAAMLALFGLGVAALVVPPAVAVPLLLAGYGALMALDPLAARRDAAPLYFVRLRPVQMAIPVVSLVLILVAILL